MTFKQLIAIWAIIAAISVATHLLGYTNGRLHERAYYRAALDEAIVKSRTEENPLIEATFCIADVIERRRLAGSEGR